jgi:hypothetical protein
MGELDEFGEFVSAERQNFAPSLPDVLATALNHCE